MIIAKAAAEKFADYELGNRKKHEINYADTIQKIEKCLNITINTNDAIIDIIDESIMGDDEAAFVEGFLTGVEFCLNQ
jgi:hypothetical protein